MQFESLKIFCDVARNRSFSQAALVNQVTQSAVSQMVAQLEKRMGVQLIDRSTRPLQLTSLGRTYYEGCKSLLEQYQELESAVRNAQSQVEGSVQVAAIYSVGLGNMGQYVEAFIEDQPEAEVHIEYCHPMQVYDRVQEGTVDLGLVSFPKKSAKLGVIPWREERMVLACSPKDPLARYRSIRVNQLDGMKFIHFSKELQIRRELDRFFRSNRITLDVVLEFDNIENIKKAIEISAGVSLLPEPTLCREVALGSLVAIPLQGNQPVRPLGIIHRRHVRLSCAARRFLDVLTNNQLTLPLDFADEGIYAGGTEHKKSSRSHRHRNGTHPSTSKSKK